MKYMKIPLDTVQKIVDYLVKQPWAEVNELLSHLQRAKIEEMEEADGDRSVDDKAGSSEPDAESG